MWRKLLTNRPISLIPRQSVQQSSSEAGRSGKQADGITLNDYHEASNSKLEELSDRLESVLEERFDKGADVSLADGVLTVVVDENNTYVINKQTPNKQIWLSSPISGPRRFDFVGGKWIDKGEKVDLDSLISRELSKLLST